MTERDERAARRAAMTRRHDEAAAEGEAEAEAELEPPSTSAADAAQQESTNQARLLADMSEQLAKMKVKLSSFNANMLKREAAITARERSVAERLSELAEHQFVDHRFNQTVLDQTTTVVVAARLQADVTANMAARLNRINAMVLEPVTNILSLPVELRAHIYRFVIGEPRSDVEGKCTRRAGNKPGHWKIEDGRPPLAQTCKIIRCELLPLYYAETRFNLGTVYSPDETRCLINAWERSLGEYVTSLRVVELDRVVETDDNRPHPDRPGYVLGYPRHQAKAKLTIQGVMEWTVF
ncbi:hypothetical protein LTR27_009149 [Elasticomyces elasticus]|nr:hypothetical protein LTR27_009149 [Elasticomyces elasticus]